MDEEEVQLLHRQRQESSRAFLRRLGVDHEALRAVSEETRSRLAELQPAPQLQDGKPVMLVLPRDVPAEIREGRANPWTDVRPPYAGWSWSYSWWAYDFAVSVNHFLDSAAGLVGNVVSLTDSDAGDFDVPRGEHQTSVGFWYLMPSAGLVEVWIEGQSAASHHHLSLYDEWWWSDSSTYQYDFLTLKATGASPSGVRTSQMSWFYQTGHTSGHWDNHYLCDGCAYWAHLYSDIAFPAGSWVWVEIGTKNTNYAFADDVSVYSDIDFRWFLRSVWVESTGG